MLEVFDRMTELQFANRAGKDMELTEEVDNCITIVGQAEALRRRAGGFGLY